ncbi:MAG: hypothetical protein GWO20_05355 [Candidatus Korarchaeota archaeon]|nr:hypothetical protein [Candidatus Korarchaeota archaeon]NIU82644.1 hypothetical protein [Candidatus Thorarchaeota archaeon]NIW13125.1 hypothetical protein [Candidatus Thorarchaeota archaeon]NIW51284.1 hypothetical protein [Candidatus Korarchaeota archaeon]
MADLESKVACRGDVSNSAVKDIKQRLTPLERLKFIAAVSTRFGTGKNYTILTNQRLLLLREGQFKLFGRGEGLKDIPYGLIQRVKVEGRKKYDLLVVYLKDDTIERFMIPKGCGAEVTSNLRYLQTLKKRKERRGETPLQKLEKLTALKEKNAISQEEFKKKKEELLRDI